MYRAVSAMSVVTIVIASVVLTSGIAYAHERRNVGPYEFAVGWLNEPAYVGVLNSIELHIVDTRSSKSVTGLEKTLSVDVQAGGLTPFKLDVAAAEDPSAGYVGWVMPTVPGAYAFHVVGKIDTQNIDEKFSSGPNTFDDVADLASLQYPTRFPVADDLGKKLDAIQSGLDQTRVIAIVALVLGVLALGTATLSRRRAS